MTEKDQAKLGEWDRALVTGASDGVGLAMAELLAAHGVDLVLVARREAVLEALAERLRAEHRVQVEVLTADLADLDSLERVEARLRSEPPVDLLVNNAGVTGFGEFAARDIDVEQWQIDVNAIAPMRLTHAVLQSMKPRRRGTILMVSSLDSVLPPPFHAVYAATKAFLNTFTEALDGELRGTGITTTTALLGYTKTNMAKKFGIEEPHSRVNSLLLLTPEHVARVTLAAAAAGTRVHAPSLAYRMYAGVVRFIPIAVRRKMAMTIIPAESLTITSGKGGVVA
ncbi:SDR family NAD(P)-dependent oxidoreductase [Gordonia sp. NPDC003376]